MKGNFDTFKKQSDIRTNKTNNSSSQIIQDMFENGISFKERVQTHNDNLKMILSKNNEEWLMKNTPSDKIEVLNSKIHIKDSGIYERPTHRKVKFEDMNNEDNHEISDEEK